MSGDKRLTPNRTTLGDSSSGSILAVYVAAKEGAVGGTVRPSLQCSREQVASSFAGTPHA